MQIWLKMSFLYEVIYIERGVKREEKENMECLYQVDVIQEFWASAERGTVGNRGIMKFEN